MSTESFKLAYPLAYWPLMERNGMDLDPLLLLAVGRKESKFDPKAVSPANAQGLLQIHPDTATRLTDGAVLDLTNPYVNITLGAHYITELLRRVRGRFPWALAAYNAGEEAAHSWRARFPSPDPILQIDLITFRETRNYVGFVLSNYYWYRRLYQPDKGHPLEVSRSAGNRAQIKRAFRAATGFGRLSQVTEPYRASVLWHSLWALSLDAHSVVPTPLPLSMRSEFVLELIPSK